MPKSRPARSAARRLARLLVHPLRRSPPRHHRPTMRSGFPGARRALAVILLLGGGILATLTYLGMRPALPPAPHKSTFDGTPAPPAPHSSDTIQREGSATADHPLPHTQTPLQSARPLAETPDGDQSIR